MRAGQRHVQQVASTRRADAASRPDHCLKQPTEAIYDAGFNSSGRFYEKSTEMLGLTPSQYRAGGANEDIKFAVGQTSLGAILVASTKKGVAAILLGDDPEELVQDLQDRFPRRILLALTATMSMSAARHSKSACGRLGAAAAPPPPAPVAQTADGRPWPSAGDLAGV